ncbi:MAG: hypothetical protein ACRCTJ_02935 [Brevinema sp.]
MIFLFLLMVSVPIINFSFINHDTLSIKGNINFRNSELEGEFWYTIKNNGEKSQNSWTVLVNHSVNILSIQQDGQEAPITIQNRSSFRTIIIKLPKPIRPNQRALVFIKFSLISQNNDPRFTINSNYVFLDARKLWFPYPREDSILNSEITIETSKNLHSILGSKIQNDAIIIDRRISTWENELASLSPRMSLIITDKPRNSNKFLNIYIENTHFSDFLSKKLEPFWKFLQSKHKNFPLSEIHIFPSDHPLDQITADGEFLGNLILLNQEMIDQYLQDPESSFFESGSIDKRIVETIIHELFHAYFPGRITHVKEDSLFIESFVQYLTWDLIRQIDPVWGQEILKRSHFLIQNMMYHTTKNPILFQFLFETIKLFGILEKSNINSIDLIDTLIEKYRFIEMSKQDVFETIFQFNTDNKQNDTNQYILKFLNQFNLEDNFSFNTTLKVETTNIFVTITNKTRQITIPVQDNLIDISHNLKGCWHGNLLVISTNITNTIPLSIPENTIWKTNIIGIIDQAIIVSYLDLIESDLSDNILKKDSIGIKLSKDINANRLEKWGMAPKHREIFEKLRSFKWKWNQTSLINNTYYISFYLQNNMSENISFVIVEIEKNGPITNIRTLL